MCQWEERNQRRSGCLRLHRWPSHRYKEAQARYVSIVLVRDTKVRAVS